jgi:hypothetical protein
MNTSLSSAKLSYVAGLTAQLWAYRDAAFSAQSAIFDPAYSHLPNPPVFTKKNAHLNVIVPDDSDLAANVLSLLSREKQHKWFRSMKSSQALALSVFGNLKILNRASCLSEVIDNDGVGLAFRLSEIESADLELEHDVTSLSEVRATSVDLFISGPTIVCVECKLSEQEVACCSRPGLKKEHREYCDGSYARQGARSHRCALAERGMTYWDHIPNVLTWEVQQDHSPCPLAVPYQLVRNVLAASVDRGHVRAGRGHALLVYDGRNPAFQPRDGGTFETLREQLRDPSILRRCTWQSILSVMAGYDNLQWLLCELGRKYGLVPSEG